MISTVGLILILSASLSFSAVDLFQKALANSISPQPLVVLMSLGTCPVFYIWYITAGVAGPESGYWLPGLSVIAINIAANLLFLYAIQISPLSLTIPFLSLTPVFTTVLAVPLLDEWPRQLQWLGIILVVLGAFGINLTGAFGEFGATKIWRAYRQEPGSVLMTLVALLWSLAAPLDKLAVTSASAAFHGFITNLGVGVGVLLLLIVCRQLGSIKIGLRRWELIIATILAGFVGLACFFEAIQRIPIGFAETLKRAIGSFAALVCGYFFFGESMTYHRATAVAVMVIGVAMLVLG